MVFKAEVACATPYAAQVQGVWVDPEHRGRGPVGQRDGRGRAAGAGTGIAPMVSLYVNEWNSPARAAYARVGFEQSARFATLMF